MRKQHSENGNGIFVLLYCTGRDVTCIYIIRKSVVSADIKPENQFSLKT